MVYIWFTNADTLTRAKIQELENEIQSSASAPDIIAEIKPKNYVRNITENDYKIKGYRVEHANLADKGSTRGVAINISESLQCNELDTCKIVGAYGVFPEEEISIELQLAKNDRMIICNIYRNPSSDDSENNKVNEFVRQFGKLKCENQVIVGDFNRKNIDWENVATTSDDDADFIEACRDSYLTQRILQPTRGWNKSVIAVRLILFVKTAMR